jgi:diadenylate cyclase
MLMNALWSVLRSINWSDLLDMAVVSLFIYSILLWFDWSKSVFVARGILILGVFYIVARQMGMVLTTWIFHGFFAVFVVALVIIFQEEIRRFFERLALWRWSSIKSGPIRSEQVEVLLQSASHYAREHIGALIVLRGRDPLERHIDGGVELDGQLSAPLLQSIFDVHSEGHDGAVLLQNERVHRFGAHLPLSKNLEKLLGVGTRHAAALGISEVTDALAIVVSEQRGTISVAQNGEIRQLSDLHELERLLNRFVATKKPAVKSTPVRNFFTSNTKQKLLAVGISFALWLIFVQGFKPDTKDFTVSVQVLNVSNGFHVRSINPHRVVLTLSGLKRDLDVIPANEIKIALNAEGKTGPAERFLVSEDNLRVPQALKFVSAEPAAIIVNLDKPQTKPEAPQAAAPPASQAAVPAPAPAASTNTTPERSTAPASEEH